MKNIKKLTENSKWVMYTIALLLGLSMGTINPLATTHMTECEVNGLWIGAISSTYFCFMAIGSIFIDKKQRGKNINLLLTIGLILTSICSIIFPLTENKFIWFILMALMGTGISFAIVGIQTAMHKVSDESNKALVSGLYSFFFAIGFVISSILGPIIYDKFNWLAFTMSTIVLIIAVLIINIKLKNLLTIPEFKSKNVFSKIKTALIGAFSYGFSETTLVSLYPLFMIKSGFELSQIGFAIGIFIIGSVIGTIPVTYLADKIGREKCLGISIFVSLFAIIGITIFDNFSSKLIFSFIGGFTIGPIYPLSLALSVQKLSKEELISGTSLFTFAYGVGSTVGPFSSSIVMNQFGNRYIFSVSFFIFIFLLIFISKNVFLEKFNIIAEKN